MFIKCSLKTGLEKQIASNNNIKREETKQSVKDHKSRSFLTKAGRGEELVAMLLGS